MPASTHIAGTLPIALGLGPATGSLDIVWPSFTSSDGAYYPAGQKTVPVSHNGAYSFVMPPNDLAIPSGTHYTCTYNLTTGATFTEYWVVPVVTSGVTLSIQQIRINKSVPPLPFQVQIAQLYSANANVGDVVIFNGLTWTRATLQSVFPFQFTGVNQLSIAAGTHGQGAVLIVQTYTSDGDQLDSAVNVNPATGDVLLRFASPQSGFGFIYGGLGRTLPNFSKTFSGSQNVTIPVSQHRLATLNLAVQIYDLDGNLMDAQSYGLQITSDYSVNIAFASPASFTVVIVGCLGVSPTEQSGGGSGTAGSALSGSGTFSVASVVDGETVTAGSITVPGATVGMPVIIGTNPALPVGVTAKASVTAANTVAVYVENLSGQDLSIASTVYSVDVVTQIVVTPQGNANAPYIQNVTSATSVAITAITHGKGQYALVHVFTNDIPSVAAVPSYTRDSSGNVVVQFGSPFTGSIQINY